MKGKAGMKTLARMGSAPGKRLRETETRTERSGQTFLRKTCWAGGTLSGTTPVKNERPAGAPEIGDGFDLTPSVLSEFPI